MCGILASSPAEPLQKQFHKGVVELKVFLIGHLRPALSLLPSSAAKQEALLFLEDTTGILEAESSSLGSQ